MHPILFKIGFFEIKTYSAIIAAEAILIFAMMYREAHRADFYPKKIIDLGIIILIFGIIGGRLLHVFVNMGYYREHPLEALFVWRGGLAIYGGIFLGILAASIFVITQKMPYWRTADFLAPYAALGQAIGRVGCFFNGCCYGKAAVPASFGVIFPGDTVARYPTQLYAAFALLGIFMALRLSGKRPHAEGAIFALYLLLYSLQRFLMDFLRGDTPPALLGLTISQMISLAVIGGATVLLIALKKRHEENKWKR